MLVEPRKERAMAAKASMKRETVNLDVKRSRRPIVRPGAKVAQTCSLLDFRGRGLSDDKQKQETRNKMSLA